VTPSAETAYLFRHSIVRDAAYELQPISERGRLHLFAFRILEDMCGGAPADATGAWVTYLKPHPTDTWAAELASHAEAARESNEPEAVAKAALYLKRWAWIEDSRFRTQDAMALYRRLVVHPGATPADRLWAAIGAAQMHYRLGEIAQAATQYEQAEELAAGVSDPAGMMVLRTGRAIIDSHNDNSERIALVHKQAAEFWRVHNNPPGEMQALVNFAIWHCEFGDGLVGEQALTEALELARKHGKPRVEAAALGNLATLWRRQGRMAESEKAMLQAIVIAGRNRNAINQVTWVQGLGELYRSTGRRKEAETQFREARKIAAAAGLGARVDYADCSLAALLAEDGRMIEAREIWCRALPPIRERGDTYTLNKLMQDMQGVLDKAHMPPLGPQGEFPA
jgi:tetratricopeptide (TPR) repeat protein